MLGADLHPYPHGHTASRNREALAKRVLTKCGTSNWPKMEPINPVLEGSAEDHTGKMTRGVWVLTWVFVEDEEMQDLEEEDAVKCSVSE